MFTERCLRDFKLNPDHSWSFRGFEDFGCLGVLKEEVGKPQSVVRVVTSALRCV